VYYEYFGDAHFFYDIGLPSNTTYYYWVRSVNKLGAISAFNSSTGTSATTAIDYLYVSDLIDDILDDDVNSLGLNTAISNAGGDVTQIQQDIDDLNSINAWNSSTAYSADTLVTHSGKIWKASQASTNQTPAAGSSYWTEIGNYSSLVDFVSATQAQNVSTLSSLNTNYYTISGANGAISAATTNLASTTYVQSELGDYTTTANLNLNYYTKTGADVAISSSIGTYTTTVGSETLTLQQHHSSINGIEGKYSIKIDDNGSVAGFGLISTANDGVPSTGTGSAFIVAADRFAITSDADATATENGTVGDNYPFKVFTTPHNVTDADGNQSYNADGTSKTIPAGVYIDNAFIHDAQITGAMIEEATITDANIGSLDAGKIRSGQIQIDNQNNFAIFQGKTQVVGQDADGNDIIEGDYSSLASGFFLGNVNGYGAFHIGSGSSRYLKFSSSNGDLIATGLEVRAPDGTVLVDAGGLTNGSGGNLIHNANFSRAELTFNSTTSAWDEATYDVHGFAEHSGTTLERRDLGYIRAGDNVATNPDNGIVRSTSQRFPVVAGETLYVYAQTSVSTGVYMQIVYYDHPDGEVTNTGYVTQTAVSNSNSDFDNAPVTVGSATRRSLIAAVTVPSDSGANYGELRFGSNTGSYVYFYGVGVSRTPPVIGPKYAATYIRDLSVDTLQIAGNAVTVADSASNFPTGLGTNKVTLEKETSLLPQGSAIIWLINAIVNDTSGNPDSYDLVVNIYTRGVNQTSYPSSPTYTKIIWIYSKSLDARMMEFSLPATSAFTDGGYMKCSVRLQTHVNNQTNYTSGTLVNGGGIEIVYLGAKK
jgi:hypothetical protein